MPRRERTPEERAAVMAALLSGQSVSGVARDFKVGRDTVRRWRDAAGYANTPVVDHQKRAEIDGLVGDLLRTILATLQIQAEQFRDTAWLKRQTASEAAVLFGVIADKGFRILEAAEAAAEEKAPDL